MDVEQATAERYGTRAEQIRMIAESVSDSNVKRILQSIAQDYERMAQSLKAVGGQNAGTED